MLFLDIRLRVFDLRAKVAAIVIAVIAGIGSPSFLVQ